MWRGGEGGVRAGVRDGAGVGTVALGDSEEPAGRPCVLPAQHPAEGVTHC